MKKFKVPFVSLEPQHNAIATELKPAITKVLHSNSLVLGNQVRVFEKKYASFTEVSSCAGVANGTDAIYLSLRALDIGAGDEVIVPTNTCAPTWTAVVMTGATIVPIEPDHQTYNLDASRLPSLITSKTKAVIPVHLYGQACNMDAIMNIASQKNIHVVEDNAQSQGSTFNGRRTGSFGIVNATSFYPSKNLGALGDAGAVKTADTSLAEKVKRLRNYGCAQKNHSEHKGVNSRLDEMQAAILTVKLRKLSGWNNARKAIARFYLKELKGTGDLVLPITASGADHVYHLFVVRTPARDALAAQLEKKGIQTLTHYPVPPHLQKTFSVGFRQGQFPIAETISNTCLSLPMWPGMTTAQQEMVVEQVKAFFGYFRAI